MKYSYLGKTGMKVPALSFGALLWSYEGRDCIGKGPDGIAAGVVPLVYQSRTLRCRRSEHVGLFCKKDSGECV